MYSYVPKPSADNGRKRRRLAIIRPWEERSKARTKSFSRVDFLLKDFFGFQWIVVLRYVLIDPRIQCGKIDSAGIIIFLLVLFFFLLLLFCGSSILFGNVPLGHLRDCHFFFFSRCCLLWLMIFVMMTRVRASVLFYSSRLIFMMSVPISISSS